MRRVPLQPWRGTIPAPFGLALPADAESALAGANLGERVDEVHVVLQRHLQVELDPACPRGVEPGHAGALVLGQVLERDAELGGPDAADATIDWRVELFEAMLVDLDLPDHEEQRDVLRPVDLVRGLAGEAAIYGPTDALEGIVDLDGRIRSGSSGDQREGGACRCAADTRSAGIASGVFCSSQLTLLCFNLCG